MDGFLSDMFGGDQGEGPQTMQSPEMTNSEANGGEAAPAGSNDGPADASTENSSQSTGIDGDGNVSFDESVELSQGGSYEGTDGNQNEWSHSNEVGAEADTAALLSSDNGMTEETYSADPV